MGATARRRLCAPSLRSKAKHRLLAARGGVGAGALLPAIKMGGGGHNVSRIFSQMDYGVRPRRPDPRSAGLGDRWGGGMPATADGWTYPRWVDEGGVEEVVSVCRCMLVRGCAAPTHDSFAFGARG